MIRTDDPSRRSTRLHAALALAVYAAAFIALFAPVLFAGRLLAPTDGLAFYYPHFMMPRALWDPRLGTGTPVFADPQTMMWYPVAAVCAWLPHGWNVYVVLAYVFASWFAFLYIREITRHDVAAFAGGLIFGASGFMMAHLPHVGVTHVALWLPLLLLSMRRIDARGLWPWGGCLALATFCCITAGHTQIAVYVLVAAAGYAVALGFGRSEGRRLVISSAAAMATGTALAGVQLLPTVELVSQSIRTGFTFAEFGSYSLVPYQLITFVFPYALGGGAPLYRIPPFGPADPGETTGYVGACALALAAIGAFLYRRNRTAAYWTVIGVIAAVLALGPATPAGALLYRVPIFGSFRAQGRFLVIADFAAAVLAAMGIAGASSGRVRLRRAAMLPALIVALAAAAVAAAGAELHMHAAHVIADPGSFLPWTNAAIGIPLLVAALFAAALAAAHRFPRPLRAMMMAAFVAIDLVFYSPFAGWDDRSPFVSESKFPEQLAPVRAELQTTGGRWLTTSGVFASREMLPPERSSLWGVSSASKFSTIMPRRYAELTHIEEYGGVTSTWSAPDDLGLDLAAVRVAAVPIAERATVDQRKWRFIAETGDAALFENLHALPRAWIATDVIVLPADDVLTAIHTSRMPNGVFDPSRTVLVEAPLESMAGLAPDGAADAQWTSSVQVVSEDATHVEVHTASTRAGVLVLADLYYPGWIASVDGELQPIHAVNHAQRGVVLTAGKHTVRFAFHPASLRAGAAVSIVGLFGLLGLAIAGRRRTVD